MKKLKNLILMALVFFVGLGFTACKNDNSEELLIIYENSVVGVTSAGKVATKIEIPNGVTSILDNAFSYCTVLKEVIIPDSVTNIGQGAFIGCSSLQEITLPFVGRNGIGYIFGSDDAFRNYNYVPDSLEKVTITKATSIGEYAFYGCSLTSITIPDSVTSIGYGAFEGYIRSTSVYYTGTIENWCNITFSDYYSNPMHYASHFYIKNGNGEYEELTEIEIPNTVTKINDYAFYGSNKVTKVTIPNSVTSIGYRAFEDCSSLTSAYYAGTIKDWCNISFVSQESNPMYYASQFYIKNSNGEYEELTEIEIPSTITKINDYAFYRFNKVTKVTIPNSVTGIGNSAFYGCRGLTSVIFKNPYGWKCCWDTETRWLSNSSLSDPSTAATYLSSKYYNYSWTRS